MAGKIPDDTLQLIRERVSIVEVVSGYVTLKKAGRNHLGLCPFHAEKTPSFTVNDERGLFHCFGCGAGGSVFTFVMRADSIGFREAVELLARRAGVALPARSERDGAEPRRQLIEVNEAAQHYFHGALRSPAGAVAQRYLERRGLTAPIIERYGLGFCPPSGGGLARALTAKQRSLQQAAELGLIGRRADGSAYDRLRGRVTFPIRDGSGNVVGFGGRRLGDDQPKYLNSPESALFHKGNVLYGLFEARQAIRETGRIVIVEGYVDALSLVQAGMGNVVASLGTALTANQLQLARRFAPEMVAFFDGDRAGHEAALRTFALSVEIDMWGFGAFLPDGFDPDSFVREQGREATEAFLQKAEPLADFFVRKLDPGRGAQMRELAAAAERIGHVIARARNPAQFAVLAKKAADQLGLDEAVFREIRAEQKVARPQAAAPKASAAADPLTSEELTLLETMALDREASRLVSEADVLASFQNDDLAGVGRKLIAHWLHEPSSTGIVDQLPDPLRSRVAQALLGGGPLAGVDPVQVAHDCIRRIRLRAFRRKKADMRASLRAAEASGDDERLREELRRANELLRRKADGHV